MSKIPQEAIEAVSLKLQNAFAPIMVRKIATELLEAAATELLEAAIPFLADAARAEGAEVEPVAITDTDRLDFLDQCNARLNAHCKTRYGWNMIMNHNVNRLMTGRHLDVDLHDSAAHGYTSCRDAIDSEIRRIKAARAALAGGEADG